MAPCLCRQSLQFDHQLVGRWWSSE
jgi:hypothetical protein